MVKENERMLTGGFYAEVTLGYDASIAQEKGGRPFGVDSLRAIQLSKREVLDVLAKGREQFRSEEHTSELQSLMRISYAVFCLKKNNKKLILLRNITI